MREDEWSRFVRDARTDFGKELTLNSRMPRWATTLMLRHPVLFAVPFFAAFVAATITPVSDWPYSLLVGSLFFAVIVFAGFRLRRKVRRYMGQPWM